MIPVPREYSSVQHYIQSGGGAHNLNCKLNLFLTTPTRAASEIWLTVKPDETCIIRNIVIYGKDLLLRQGTLLPQALNRLSRTLPDVNEIYPTMDAKIETIQTVVQQVAKNHCFMWSHT